MRKNKEKNKDEERNLWLLINRVSLLDLVF